MKKTQLINLNAENFPLQLSLEREKTLKCQFLVESAAEEILRKAGVHGLESVTSDCVITMPHANTALRTQHVTNLITTQCYVSKQTTPNRFRFRFSKV